MDDNEDNDDLEDVPDGAAVFPLIPDELGVHPLLLVAVHAVVFLAGSLPNIVHPAAGDEALDRIAQYLSRLNSAQRKQIQEDMRCLTEYARHEKWPKQLTNSLKAFLSDFGIADTTEE